MKKIILRTNAGTLVSSFTCGTQRVPLRKIIWDDQRALTYALYLERRGQSAEAELFLEDYLRNKKD